MGSTTIGPGQPEQPQRLLNAVEIGGMAIRSHRGTPFFLKLLLKVLLQSVDEPVVEWFNEKK
jgi:hypothetical protein